MRFHLDEHMERSILNGLLHRGIDATITADVGLAGASDEQQITFAFNERRVLVTRDSDFLNLAATGIEHAGIVLAKPGRRMIGPTILALVELHRTTSQEEMVGRVVFV
jgi:predicted nuclease of predicted toxin-antitoxin system